jgi:protein SCO1/2
MNKRTALILCMGLLAVALLLLPETAQKPGQGYGEAQVGGAFTLTDTHGSRVSNTAFNGKLTLVYLGYTHCPDICPATLSNLSGVLKKIGTDAEKVNVVFISLDPLHDTPEVLGKYLEAFDPRIVGLTGSETEIKTVVKEYKAYATPDKESAPGNMLIAHSGLLYLMGRNGKFIQHFETGVSEAVLIAALKANF